MSMIYMALLQQHQKHFNWGVGIPVEGGLEQGSRAGGLGLGLAHNHLDNMNYNYI